LRSGIAETLSLLGVYGSEADHASQRKAEWTVGAVIREILKPEDWRRWGSLDQLLPMLAEAAPSAFLDAVENALRFDPPPFNQLFLEEGGGLSGGNYMTGLLWALEILAWSEESITRVVLILGELASLDPGGNWATGEFYRDDLSSVVSSDTCFHSKTQNRSANFGHRISFCC
jgi:hypothetical protein